MRPSKQFVYELFDRQRRYVVPLFQRPYVWNRDEQWQPLWDDIEEKTVSILEQRSPYPHFLGAVVLNQVKVFGRQIDAAEIIDGQQRLTTLQVFLTAFRDILATSDDVRLHQTISALTENRCLMDQDDERFKVWPTNADRETFRDVLSAGSPTSLEQRYPLIKVGRGFRARPRLIEAYAFFHARITELANAEDHAGTTPVERLQALFEALRRRLQVVVIELEDEDDPQVIFETLNARGVPLLPSDLIRNFVFLRAARQQENQEQLYERWWRHYDELPAEGDPGRLEVFWKREERQGRARRPRLDLFFHHYLQFRTERDVNLGHTFQEFRIWWESAPERSVAASLAEFRRFSDTFREFFLSGGDSRLSVFAERLRILDTSTVYPLMLFLLVEVSDRIAPAERDAILTDLESYLVRRLVCDLGGKHYNKFFLQLLRNLREEEVVDRETVRRHLLAAGGESTRWPDDREFERHWLHTPVYSALPPTRVAMVLLAIDRSLLTAKQEQVVLGAGLTIEHVLPQAWHDAWPAPTSSTAAEGENAEERRNRLLHTFGNLTLLTQALNSSVSCAAFDVKKPHICRESALRLNAYFQDRLGWDEDSILDRGATLFRQACRIWPFPSDPERRPTEGGHDREVGTIRQTPSGVLSGAVLANGHSNEEVARMNATNTTRIVIDPRFVRPSAGECLAAIDAAGVRCLSAARALIEAHYRLSAGGGPPPNLGSLIDAARQIYQPPRAEQDLDRFWRDYALTNLRRGIFVVAP